MSDPCLPSEPASGELVDATGNPDRDGNGRVAPAGGAHVTHESSEIVCGDGIESSTAESGS
jgi:hypothetical protein